MIRVMVCSICNKSKRENIILLGKNICGECEAKLVKAKVEDMAYRLYLDGIKQILAGDSRD